MHTLLKLSAWIDRGNEYLGRFVYWFSLIMIAVGTWNVIGRYVGRTVGQNLSSNALIETQWYIFDIIFLLGAAYALKHNEHVRVDVIQSRLSPKQKAFIDCLGTLIFLIPFCVMIIFYSWGWVMNSWTIQEVSPDPGGLPRYPIKTLVIISFILLLFQGISEAIKNFAIFRGILESSIPENNQPRQE